MAKKRKLEKPPREQSTRSRLSDHRRTKKMLKPPLSNIPGITYSSWVDERLADMLWAALFTAALPRDRYLQLFRGVIAAAQQHRDSKLFITHSALALATEQEFRTLFRSALQSDDTQAALSPLLLFPEIPDFAHWRTRLPTPDPKKAVQVLAQAIVKTLDHQSEAATDIRWLKVAFLAVQHRLQVPAEKAEQIAGYPNVGDLRSVRPSMRSMEIMIGAPDLIPTSEWPSRFWDICYEMTDCRWAPPPAPILEFPHAAVNQSFGKTYGELANHCHQTIATTRVDPRHDGVFGLGLYGLSLVGSLFRPYSTRPAGRIILRSLVEVYLTLAYLLKKDSLDLWRQYRSHGSGQAKLSFLKIADGGGELPKYVGTSTLEALANDDMWQEFVDINIGHWAGKDLRRMSEEAGVKNIYDKYYDWPSSFVHGQWGAVRNTVYDFCANPLHRLHRIPRTPRFDLEDVSWDGVTLANEILNLVDTAYPKFKHRLIDPTEASPKPKRKRSKKL